MRCNKHCTDLSSTIGVCASCLRERLLSLIPSQLQLQNSDRNPAFPASVSPQLKSRKSDRFAGAASRSDNTRRKDAPRYHHSQSEQLFYRTPQGGPASGRHHNVGDSKKKLSFIRLFSFSNIFRSRHRKPVDSVTVSDARAPVSTFRESRGSINATSSSSWFSGIISGGRRRRKQTVYIDETNTTAGGEPVRQQQQFRDRGMSPVRNADVTGGEEDELPNAASGYESTESWKNTPRRTPGIPAVRRGGSGGHMRNISSLTFCLSPLVRASPNRQWNQKGLPPDVVLSGEVGAPVKPHLSNAKSFCANRSRKLADFGRPNLNR